MSGITKCEFFFICKKFTCDCEHVLKIKYNNFKRTVFIFAEFGLLPELVQGVDEIGWM